MELRQTYKLDTLLKISSLARSTFYYHLNARKTDKYSETKQVIKEVFSENDGRYGYRRITYILYTKGIKINHKTVLKLMKSMKIRGKMRKNEQYHSYKGEVGKVADNLLQRDFNAAEPFEKLATDVTQFKVKDKKIYLSPIMGLYNNEIVAYSISLHPDLAQTREMLEELSERLPQGAKPVLHSDQGWQYQHAIFQRYLKEHNITQSMSRKGNRMDNGAMECFFGRLKVEMYYGEKFESADDFIQKLHKYIFYWNNKRISRKLKGMSPVQYRTHSKTI
ncbi:MAG TPA: IS3 family transposase [Candidatus Caccalectryoclostridium excrementigallinarum]|uniref:IS3 family transposase n=1 Tax=Candidatus Caccalectryoclostridium excrementigallinarum TaxID=2840710 RepID=A0A9D1MLF5_9FIRM|nr:IS3 family transposase [Candidatus Caccalectryoclostridium excrementigallinarum]